MFRYNGNCSYSFETDDITEITQVKDAMEEPSKKKQQVAASPRVTCSATTATVETKWKKLTGAKEETENFYTLRVWFVSGHKTWLAGIIIVLSILQLGTGIGQYSLDAIPASLSGLLLKLYFTLAATAYVTITGSVLSVYARGALITQGVASTSTIICDALISGSLVYFLREKPLHRSLRIGIGKITIYSINIGLITVAVSTITVITWLTAPHPQFTWTIFFFPAAQVYVNSVLVSLNARKEIRAQMIIGYSRPHSSMFMSFNVDEDNPIVEPQKRNRTQRTGGALSLLHNLSNASNDVPGEDNIFSEIG
ncbi:hypothetical protein M422DRAFT_253757 [Sphaerobolus stellatus SS14]|uniref:DUF6534 domain-containing protein n=1 Tax=Sphaerobolus stellatus (strain SS14) TaxID=990650 RepID=A0A0C9VX61_SPHS4|nr:hypothetical protein M422DRAFT_253757 [Sphaerobolus stellatus SS14]